ncbi:hypothetical protein [Candidatus Albibeggiatoa sp. nov. BB20]|uniref:hypothetical protein n=1 Tax=Candidatus Albibeggiatoa sp. nov. BB20 TaxID=3162723 RepID=UPI003365A61D
MKTLVIGMSIIFSSLVITPVLASEEKGVSLEPIVNATKNAIPSSLKVPANVKDTLVPISVRVPEGDIETFWSQQAWADLNPAEQALWAVLGWNEASWLEEQPAPASDSKTWFELTENEIIAAQQLGYTQELWDTASTEDAK